MAPDRGSEEQSFRSSGDLIESQASGVQKNRNSSLFTVLLAFAAIVVFLSGCGIVVDFSAKNSVFLTAHESPTSNHDATFDASPTSTSSSVTQPMKPFKFVKDSKYLLPRNWISTSEPQRREYTWELSEVEYNPDGVYRRMILINGQFPGPLIEANEGDSIVVHVHNAASNATSIHWHGLYQNGTNWMDGTVGVTQCPIAPGSDFRYEFQVRNQSGTYWYHAHQAMQVADGVYGPLVIHSRDESTLQEIEYASDRVIMLSDHYHDLSANLMMQYLASDRENIEPVPDAALINGYGIRDCTNIPEERKCDNTTSNVGLPHFRLESGQRHRIRLVNVASLAEFQISIDEQEFSVTEVDGTDVHPESFHRLNINPGQRYSIVLDFTETLPNHSTWLRAKMLTGCFREKNVYLNPEIHAVVNTGHEDDDALQVHIPSTVDWDDAIGVVCRDMNTSALHPVVHQRAPSVSDASFYLRSNFEIGAWRLSRGFFNGSSWRPMVTDPTLHRTIDGLANGNLSFAAPNSSEVITEAQPGAFVNNVAFDSDHELVIQTHGLAVLDILIVNFDDGNHPMHLHGHKFFVLGQGHGYPPESEELPDTLDLENPLRRDTASVEGYGWLLIRVIADNPGLWALHCHISWHTEAGLLMQLLARPDVLGKLEIPERNRRLCDAPMQELKKGGTPPDESFYGHINNA